MFAYRIEDYYKCMCRISKMMKELRYLSNLSRTSPLQNEKMETIFHNSERKIEELKRLKKDLHNKENRLSTAFVVFETHDEQKRAVATFEHSLFKKLFFKLCTCCSNSVILGQHVSVVPAPPPDDVNWVNLDNPYCRIKFTRFASSFACFTILLFGISS